MKEKTRFLKRRVLAFVLVLALAWGLMPGMTMVAEATEATINVTYNGSAAVAQKVADLPMTDGNCTADVAIALYAIVVDGQAPVYGLLNSGRTAVFELPPMLTCQSSPEAFASVLQGLAASMGSNTQVLQGMLTQIDATMGAHTHEWLYTINDNKDVITAQCQKGSTRGTVTLNAEPKMEYTGGAYDGVTVENTVTGLETIVKYVGTGDTYYAENTTAPTQVGTYQATVTLGDVTAEKAFVIEDTKAPVIKGIVNNKAYCGDVTFSVDDAALDKVYVNDTEVTLSNGKYTLTVDSNPYTVKATDKNGNETSVTVTVASHQWSSWTIVEEPTADKEGKKERKCTNDCGVKQVATTPKAGEEDPYQNFEKFVQSTDGEFDATMNNSKEDLLNASGIFTVDEKAQVEAGTAANVWLEITAGTRYMPSEEDLALIKAAHNQVPGEGGQLNFFDLSLYKQVGNNAAALIEEPGSPISVTISIPEEFLNAEESVNRVFYVLRLHDGAVEILDGTVNDDGTFTFETDKFSLYAIGYKDLNTDDMENGGIGDGDEGDDGENGEKIDKTPETSDKSEVVFWLALMMICGLSVLVLGRKRLSKK